MHSESSSDIQKKSFIEETRRAQIIDAAITTLTKQGYAKASLARIATEASISTSLILYHFTDKQALMLEVMKKVNGSWTAYIDEQLQQATSSQRALRHYIEASLAFMGTRPKYFGALTELTFNARDLFGSQERGKMSEDPSITRLTQILSQGQRQNEFKKFDPLMMAFLIRGAIDQFLGYMSMYNQFDLGAYTEHVVATFEQVIVKEGK